MFNKVAIFWFGNNLIVIYNNRSKLKSGSSLLKKPRRSDWAEKSA